MASVVSACSLTVKLAAQMEFGVSFAIMIMSQKHGKEQMANGKKNTDQRIDRLLGCAEEAEHCQQQLLAAEAQLSEYKDSQKSKSKSVLMNMADGKESALKHAVFSSWLGYIEKMHAEKEIRKKFEDQIQMIEMKLIQYKEAQIANIRGVLMRGAMEETDVLMHFVWKTWVDEVKERKADGDTA